MQNYKVGDKVSIQGYEGTMAVYGGIEEITEVKDKYDCDTGEKFQIVKVGSEWYNTRNGSCYSNKNYMYYMNVD